MKSLSGLTQIICLLLAINIFPTSNEFDEALKLIKYKSPNEFKNLPASIKKYLADKGLKIPQPHHPTLVKENYNVIYGNFFEKKSKKQDVAIVCSKDNISNILVFKNSDTNTVTIAKIIKNKNYLQGIGNNKIGFSLIIGVAQWKYIYKKSSLRRIKIPNGLKHQGIEVAFIGKASYVLYFYQNKWNVHPGGD